MNINEVLYQRFEDYLSGGMPVADRTIFESELQGKDFKNAFDDFKATQNLLILNELSLVNAAFLNAKHKKSQRIKRLYLGSAVAASILGLLSFMLWPATDRPSPTAVELIETTSDIPTLSESPTPLTSSTLTENISNSDEEAITENEPHVEALENTAINLQVSEPIKPQIHSEEVLLTATPVVNTTKPLISKIDTFVNEVSSKEQVLDCSTWSVETTVSNTCFDKLQGEISITTDVEYTVDVFRYEIEMGTFNESLTDLDYGVYFLDITGSNGCKKTFEEIEVRNVLCLDKIYYLDRTLNPTIIISVPADYSGSYQVIDASGVVLKRGETMVANTIEWNGNDTNGSPVHPGVYILITTEGDQSSQSKISVR